MTDLSLLFRAVCRKHELMQYDLEMAAQDLTSKKQQCEELATGVSLSTFFSRMGCFVVFFIVFFYFYFFNRESQTS